MKKFIVWNTKEHYVWGTFLTNKEMYEALDLIRDTDVFSKLEWFEGYENKWYEIEEQYKNS